MSGVNGSGGITITIRPTERFFMAGEVMVRAWTGVDQDGAEVVALVALVRGTNRWDQLVPVPPPDAAAARRWAETIMRASKEAEWPPTLPDASP